MIVLSGCMRSSGSSQEGSLLQQCISELQDAVLY